MRYIDKKKGCFGKAQKGINFDKIVLEKLEEYAKKEGTNVSRLVNVICRRVVLDDEVFYSEWAKFHCMKMNEFVYMRDRAKEAKE